MALAIDIMDGHGLSNKARRERLPKECYISRSFHSSRHCSIHGEARNKKGVLQCTEVSGRTVRVAKHLKTRLGSSFTVRISA